MNRRIAILYIVFSIGMVVSCLSLLKWWAMRRKPDLAMLDAQKQLISSLAECIIPRTDSPGAKDAHVEDFIIAMVRNGLLANEQNTFLLGLRDVTRKCLLKYQKSFTACDFNEQREIIKDIEAGDRWVISNVLLKVKRRFLGRSFFQLLKELTVIGYCTSEVGATQGLAYDYIPVQYHSCIVLKGGQKVWATD